MMKTEQKVLEWIRARALLRPGETVTVALSGGADSVALLAILRALGPELGIRLRAAHFHHGLRGAEADRDAEFCRDLCGGWGIPFTVGRGDVAAHAAASGQSVETAARTLRYAFLEQVSPGLIATAHNADDNAETLLLHLIRGTGPRGLGGIPPRRGRIVRPLLEVTRAEIAAYLAGRGLPYVEDSTNAADDCLRNRVRHRIMPLLQAENPRLIQAMGRTAALARTEDAYLARLAAEAAAACRDGSGWSCTALGKTEPVLRRRILLSILEELGLESPTEACVATLERLITGPRPSAVLRLPGGVSVCRSYDRLLTRLPAVGTLPLCLLKVPGVTQLPGDLGEISASVTKNSEICKKNLTTFAVKYDSITPRVWQVRGRAPGDSLTLSGGTKSLKARMIDRKIPTHLRPRMPVLLCDGRVIGVFGLGLDPAYAACPGQEALVFRYEGPAAAGQAEPDPTQRGRSE